MGYSSLFIYATQTQKLSESQAYNVINVAKKTTEVPELKLEKKIRRAQDLLSQKRKRPCSLEETLEALTGEYLERHDPVRKAERQKKLGTCQVKASRTIPSSIKHQVARRDKGHCQYHHPNGKPCGSERWILQDR